MHGEHQLSRETISELERTASPELQSRFYSVALENFCNFSFSKFFLYKVNTTLWDFVVFSFKIKCWHNQAIYSQGDDRAMTVMATHYFLLKLASCDVLSLLRRQVLKAYHHYDVQRHSNPQTNLSVSQLLKEWWLLGLSHSSRRTLQCPKGSLPPGIRKRCQENLCERHHLPDKDNSSSFNNRERRELSTTRSPDPDWYPSLSAFLLQITVNLDMAFLR